MGLRLEDIKICVNSNNAEDVVVLDKTKVEALTAFYRQYYNTHREEHTNLFEGIIQMLDDLHEMNCQMGIVTNKGTNGLVHGLDKFDMKDYCIIIIKSH